MAHNIDFSNNRANIAYLGSRDDVWHRLGQEMPAGATVEQWAAAAGLGWSAVKVPAIADLSSIPGMSGRTSVVDGQKFIARSDTGAVLGYASDGYHCVQPADVLAWFQQFISVDDKFQLDVAGSLKGGKIIWATATYNGPLSIIGEQHVARLLMTTTFDQTGSTINKGVMTRVVCNNTLDAAMMESEKAIVRTRHNTRFDARRAADQLATVSAGYAKYAAMAEAMVKIRLTQEQVSQFFKVCLDIPFDAKQTDISSRKLNLFHELGVAYRMTVQEGTESGTAWTALNAITRYVDHTRSTKGENIAEGRFHSAQFGSGAALKSKAVGLLLAA